MSNASNPNSQQDMQQSAPAVHEHETAPEQEAIAPYKALIGIGLVVVLAVGLVGFGILHRMNAETVLAKRTNELAPPTVTIATSRQGAPVGSLVLPGNVTAYTDSPIYARTSGYLTRWYFDIGAKVKKGALLATIASPEVDQQLRQAEADLATAQATANNARQQADRYSGLVKSDAVSRQDTESFVNQAAATASAVRSAQANLQRLHEMQGFEKIYAPFDGVITARTVDNGQLIDTGTGKELFRLQAIQTLRVFVNLPQVYSASMKPGAKVGLLFAEHAGKSYEGTLVRTAQAIDPTSRTLLVEVDVDNKAAELLPGSLAEVHFKIPAGTPSYVVPSAALIFRKEGLRISTVVNANGNTVAHLVPVAIGEDDGANVQIVNGLSPTDQVIQDPPDSLIEGERVSVVTPSAQPNAGGK